MYINVAGDDAGWSKIPFSRGTVKRASSQQAEENRIHEPPPPKALFETRVQQYTAKNLLQPIGLKGGAAQYTSFDHRHIPNLLIHQLQGR